MAREPAEARSGCACGLLRRLQWHLPPAQAAAVVPQPARACARRCLCRKARGAAGRALGTTPASAGPAPGASERGPDRARPPASGFPIGRPAAQRVPRQEPLAGSRCTRGARPDPAMHRLGLRRGPLAGPPRRGPAQPPPAHARAASGARAPPPHPPAPVPDARPGWRSRPRARQRGEAPGWRAAAARACSGHASPCARLRHRRRLARAGGAAAPPAGAIGSRSPVPAPPASRSRQARRPPTPVPPGSRARSGALARTAACAACNFSSARASSTGA